MGGGGGSSTGACARAGPALKHAAARGRRLGGLTWARTATTRGGSGEGGGSESKLWTGAGSIRVGQGQAASESDRGRQHPSRTGAASAVWRLEGGGGGLTAQLGALRVPSTGNPPYAPPRGPEGDLTLGCEARGAGRPGARTRRPGRLSRAGLGPGTLWIDEAGGWRPVGQRGAAHAAARRQAFECPVQSRAVAH